MRVLKHWHGFWKISSANVGMKLSLALIPIMLGAGVAIDAVRANYVRTVLQGAADAAALAGSSISDKSDAALDAMVKQYLQANDAIDVLNYVTAIEQKIDNANSTLSVSIEGKINSGFMQVAGFSSMDVGAKSEVHFNFVRQ